MAAAGRWRAGLALLAVALGLGGPRAEQTEEHLKREHSLSKPYQGKWGEREGDGGDGGPCQVPGNGVRYRRCVWAAGVGSASSGLWDLLGNAMVMTQFIRLTPDVQSKQGAVWNRVVSGGHRGGGRDRGERGMGTGDGWGRGSGSGREVTRTGTGQRSERGDRVGIGTGGDRDRGCTGMESTGWDP